MATSVKQIDIARHVGVSQATVSRVLGGGDGASISAALRERIQVAARELGYRPRRSPATESRLRTIGLLLCGEIAHADITSHHYFSRYYVSILRAVQAHAASLLLLELREPGAFPAQLSPDRLDGVIALGEIPDGLEALPLPVVLLRAYPPVAPLDVVRSHDEWGLYPALRHLVALGHHRIALFDLLPFASPMHALRADSYRRALEALGLPWRDAFVGRRVARAKTQAEIDQFAGEVLDAWLALPEPPTAAVATSDLYALGMLRAAGGRGLRVPEEFSITGYDDLDHICALSDPPITSVNQHIEQMSEHACRFLFERLEAPDIPIRQLLVTPSVTVRNSTAPPVQGRAGDPTVSPAHTRGDTYPAIRKELSTCTALPRPVDRVASR